MKKNEKLIRTKSSEDLAEALGLPKAAGFEMEFRSDLNTKIIEAVEKAGLTHAQVGQLAKTSRTRITALLNRNTQEISTDLMLRVLGSLGYRAKLSISRIAA